MTAVVISALAFSMFLYIAMGIRYSSGVRGLGDLLPLLLGKNARVNNHREFGASTVAATISLATVIVAFYELVPTLGFWLLWTAITTAMGLLLFSLFAERIWNKMALYDYRPTLHAYLGTEFDSSKLAFVASLFTAIEYLSAFAVELTVGARFLAGLLPQIPQLATVIVIAVISFTYTGMGGFRVVVVTDRIQMWFIWLLLFAIGVYYSVHASQQGWTESIGRIPPGLRTLTWNNGLSSFIAGILIMNLLTFTSNMGLWQRIAGSQQPSVLRHVVQCTRSIGELVTTGVCRSGILHVCSPGPGREHSYYDSEYMETSALGRGAVFCIVLGLYGAMLSTASTQLIAATHTLYEDVLAPFRKIDVHLRADMKIEVFRSRLILVFAAVVAVFVVELLRTFGFTVADMAFAVYGAALGLVPPILFTLFLGREVTQRLSTQAAWAVTLGFISCWGAAAYGRLTGNANLVFLAPVVSTTVATVIMTMGWLLLRLGLTTGSRAVAPGVEA